ncbi:lipase maturation factor 2-like [Belonocnema kinseyi]|uniref:lipase maturation factor 2-like n=1 Tax=Belonocnema kinseyi TaxID=2817044 RepID=UPI00143D7D97|nr:lipase maturation factor 2-like [Belonocnema kinseyi]
MFQVRYTRNLFLRGLCIIYLFAFLSFYIQIPGLYGDNGILPAKTQVDLKLKVPLSQKLMQKPTLVWFAPYLGLNVEYMLDVLALSGIILSFLGFVSQKFCIAPVFAGLWATYYSLYQVGQIFMWFQWDSLLLETGFLCIIIAPLWNTQHSKAGTPSDSVTFWTIRWLYFRLMFSSGVLKLSSGCPTWWNLEALNVHFESQCIPTPLAWYAHNLPVWFLRLSTVHAIVSELVIPFLFFFPNRKVRITAFYIQLFLMINIIATGNYNFFNLLTICLSLSLLDDQFFYKKKSKTGNSGILNYLTTIVCIAVYAAVLYGTYVYYNLKLDLDNWTIHSAIAFTQKQFDEVLAKAVPISVYIGMISLGFTVADAVTNSILNVKGLKKKVTTTLVTVFYTLIVGSIFALSVVPYSSLHSSHNQTVPIQLKKLHAKVDPFQIVNTYGLFRRMTGVGGRPEITIEGSNSVDGPWKEYGFLYKPGNVNNSMPFVAPHQPRLDWQMWFAALGTYHQNPWLMSFAYRLLNGQKEVLALINIVENPFRDNPPKYVKASLYHYHYTQWSQKNSQAWWTREKVGEYFPVFSRDHPPLLEYLAKMKIVQDKPAPKVSNEPVKFVLDHLRAMVSKIEASILLWGVFTAGCAIILTASTPAPKKK